MKKVFVLEIKQQTYQGTASKDRMQALVRASPDENMHVIDLPYRFSSWAFDTPENVGLWADSSGKLMAWAVLQTPFWTLDFALHPDAPPEMLPQQLGWADQQAAAICHTPSGRPIWFANVFRRQERRIRALEAAGFVCQADVSENSWSKVFLRRILTDSLPTAELPAGFSIRPLAGVDEAVSAAALHHAAFGSENMTDKWRRSLLARAEYRPQLDLVAVAPDSQLAAFCLCWFDPAGRDGLPSGQIEPMGAHPDFQRRGLGHVLLSEALRLLHEMGAVQVFVESEAAPDPTFAFYQSIGFRVFEDVLVYRKDYS